ncbi:MAG TPA: hypothetical protein VI913_00965 [Candidatus Peribacteraceae bacterium]|nr:hypothetical protein [Candidatus Peribacteraceae bacterium]
MVTVDAPAGIFWDMEDHEKLQFYVELERAKKNPDTEYRLRHLRELFESAGLRVSADSRNTLPDIVFNKQRVISHLAALGLIDAEGKPILQTAD